MSESRSPKTEVRLRTVYTSDIKDLWIWRNNLDTRINSLNRDYVPWVQHAEWFWNIYGSYDQKLFIAESYGVPVGTCRLDYGPDEVELNWTVAPEFRQQGFGLAIVQAALKKVDNPKLPVVAVIRISNIASLKIAEYLEFKETSRTSEVITLTRQPK